MKSKHAFTFRAILIAALFLIAPITKAQNLVKNGNLENGFTTCHKNGVWNNGPFFFGENLVDDWYGQNYGAGSSNHPSGSGSIYDNTAGCTFGKFPAIPAAISAYKGDRSGQVRVRHDVGNDVIYGNWVRGDLTGTLAEGCYWVCLATANHGPNNVAGIVEVVLGSSTSADQAIILRYIIPANSGWKKNKAYFQLLPSEAGKYDRVFIRIDEAYLTANSNSTNYINNVLFDDVSIAPCTSDPTFKVADAGFTYTSEMQTVPGGEAPVISTTADNDDDLYLHRWDIFVSTDVNAPEEDWVHLDANSETVLEDATFNSGTLEVATEDKYYKVIHLIVNPCYGWDIAGKLVKVRWDGIITDEGDIVINDPVWEPVGDEFDEPDPMKAAPGTRNNKSDKSEVSMFEIWPNPPVNEITITATEHNTNKLIMAKCVVFDSKGATVIPSTDISENNTINISALPTGVYYIQVTNSEKVEIQKFIKK